MTPVYRCARCGDFRPGGKGRRYCLPCSNICPDCNSLPKVDGQAYCKVCKAVRHEAYMANRTAEQTDNIP